MKKINTFYFLLFTYFFCFSQNNVQQSDQFQIYQNKIPSNPTSPSAYQFQRYGNIGLSEYTGTPRISIPLYTINEGNITVPIAINYNVGGIKVNQDASWVGLGWDLNFGGIYQSINDIDDLLYKETPQTYFRIRPDFASGNPGMINSFPMRDQLYGGFYNGIFVGHPHPETNISNNTSIMKSYDYHVPVNGVLAREVDMFTNQNYDSEPDFFTASFFGHKIDFIFDFETYNIEILNEKGYKIELIRDYNDDIDSYIIGYDFIITVPDGKIFYFEQDERILRSSSYPNSGGLHKIRSRNWKITKIKDIHNNEIDFTYTNIQNIINTPNIYQTYTQNLFSREKRSDTSPNTGVNSYTFDIYQSSQYDNYLAHETDGTLTRTFYDETIQNELYPLSITWSQGSVNFSVSPRIDRIGSKKLDNITINNGNQNIKIFDFDYNYFEADTNYNEIQFVNYQNVDIFQAYDTQFNNRLKLNWIEENNDKRHSFSYNSKNLPPKNSTSVDYWGFFNGSFNISLPPNPIDLHPTSAFNLIDNGNNKNASLLYTKASSLEEVQYPTKGKVKLDYELNTADNFIITTSNDKSRIPTSGNGLRLKKQTLFSNNSEIAQSTEYQYFNGKFLLPQIFQKKYNVYYASNIFEILYKTIFYYNATIFETNSNNSISLNAFSGDNFVGYEKVIIENKSNGVNTGKLENYYYNDPGFSTIIADGKYNGTIHRKSNKKANGSLLKSEIYNQNNDLIKKDTFSYNYITSLMDYGVRLSNSGGIMYHIDDPNIPTLIVSSVDLLNYYPIFSGKTLSKTQKTFEYFETGVVEFEIKYTYDALNRVTKNQSTNLTADINISNSISYQGSNDFVTRNMLLEPWIKEKRITGSSSDMNFDQKITYNYSTNSHDHLVIEEIFDCKEYENQSDCNGIMLNRYDNKGNIVEYNRKNDISNVIIWGYNKNHIIAKIQNATYSQVASALGVSETSLLSYNESNLSSINGLRATLTSSLITTYTYNKLIGVTSIIDPRGEALYYHYDDFNRLEFVKDAQGNILSKNQYNYKN